MAEYSRQFSNMQSILDYILLTNNSPNNKEYSYNDKVYSNNLRHNRSKGGNNSGCNNRFLNMNSPGETVYLFLWQR